MQNVMTQPTFSYHVVSLFACFCFVQLGGVFCYPHTLDEHELKRWHDHCRQHIDIESYLVQLEHLVYEYEHQPAKIYLLRQLFNYIQQF